MQLSGLDSRVATGWSWDPCFTVLLVGIVLDVKLSSRPASFVSLLGFFLKHAFRQKLTKTMLLVPSVISCELMAGGDFLMAANLEFVQVGQMTFRANMSKKMGDIAEGWSLGADAALEQGRSHWRRLLERR